MFSNPFDFKYTHAVVYRVPSSLKEATYRRKDPLTGMFRVESIDLEKAIEQHNEYILTLRKLGLDVIELQADDTLPDSTFVDCIAVICNGTALIAKPHLVSRRKEADVIKSLLRKEGLNIVEIKDPIATIDASDVFFTGREFFVGISKRTNLIGAKAVASAFPEYPVALIKLRKGGFHLKAYVSVAGPDLLAIGSSEAAKDILRQMKEIAEYKKYQVITIPDVHGVNCLYVNNTLIHCSRDELFNSAKIFAYKIDYPRVELKNREFAKIERFFTCRSLLFTKHKLYNILLSKYYSNLVSVSPTPALVAAIHDEQKPQLPQPQNEQPANLNITVHNNNNNNNNALTNNDLVNNDNNYVNNINSVNKNSNDNNNLNATNTNTNNEQKPTKVVKKANFNFNNNSTIFFNRNEDDEEANTQQQRGYRIDL